MERLIKRLEPASGMKKATKAIFRPLRKENVKDVLDTIERQKTLFILALQSDHIGLSQAIKESVNLVQNGMQDVLKGISDLDRKQNCHTEISEATKANGECVYGRVEPVSGGINHIQQRQQI